MIIRQRNDPGAPWATFRAGFAAAKVTWWGGVKSSYLAKATEANSKATTYQNQVNGRYRTENGTKSTANVTNAQRTADADYTQQINQAAADYRCDLATADAVANFTRATAQVAYATATGTTAAHTASEVFAAYQRERAVAEGRRSIAMEGANQTFATSSGQAEVDWTRDTGAAETVYADAESTAYATTRSELAGLDADYFQHEADTFATAAASFAGSDTPWGGYESGKAAAFGRWQDSVSPAAKVHATGVANLDSSLEQQIAAADEVFANQSAAADRLDGVASAAAAVADAVLDALRLVNTSPTPDLPTTPASVETAIDATRSADFEVTTARAVVDAGHATLAAAIHVGPWPLAQQSVFSAALAVRDYHPYPNNLTPKWRNELTDAQNQFVWAVPFKADQAFGVSPQLEHGLITQLQSVPADPTAPMPPDISIGLNSATLRDQIVPPSSIDPEQILADSSLQLFVDLFSAPGSLIASSPSTTSGLEGTAASESLPELAGESAGAESGSTQPTDDPRERLKRVIDALLEGRGQGWTDADRSEFWAGFGEGCVDGIKGTLSLLKTIAVTAADVSQTIATAPRDAYVWSMGLAGDWIASKWYGIPSTSPGEINGKIVMARKATAHAALAAYTYGRAAVDLAKEAPRIAGEVSALSYVMLSILGEQSGISLVPKVPGLSGTPADLVLRKQLINTIIDKASPLTVVLLNYLSDLTPRQCGYVTGLVFEQVLEAVAVAVATAGMGALAESGVQLPRLGQLLRASGIGLKAERIAAIERAVQDVKIGGEAAEDALKIASKLERQAGNVEETLAKVEKALGQGEKVAPRKLFAKVFNSFEAFARGRTFASPAEAQKAWQVYQRAARSKGLIIGKTQEILRHAGQGGRDVLYFVLDSKAPYGGWTWEINKAWLDGAVDARLTVKLLTPASELPKSGALWREFNYLISKGYMIKGGMLVPPVP